MKANLAQVWRDALLHPRSALADHVRAGPRGILLVIPACAGALQSFIQGATSSVGAQASIVQIFALAIPIGALWGLLQLHLLAVCLWPVARKTGQRLPFRLVRHVVALAMAPAATAFLAWVTVAVLLGRIAFVSPEAWAPNSISIVTLLTMMALYLGSVASVLWNFVVLAFAVREATATSMGGAIATIAKGGLVLMAVCFVGVSLIVLVAIIT